MFIKETVTKMLLRQIKYFITVVKLGSFTEAAEECFISQSAVSQQISALESELGVKLLRRYKRRFELTEAGRYMYKHGLELLIRAEKLQEEVCRIGFNETGNHFTIGYLKGYSGGELQETISALKKLNPELTINIISGSHKELYEGMVEDKFDMVLSDIFNDNSTDCGCLKLIEKQCYVDICADNPLSRNKFIETADLNKISCIIVADRGQRDNEKDFYYKWFADLDSKVIFAGDTEEAKLLAASGQGFMPVRETKEINAKSNGIVRIPVYKNGKLEKMSYYLIWHKNRKKEIINTFAGLLFDNFNNENLK